VSTQSPHAGRNHEENATAAGRLAMLAPRQRRSCIQRCGRPREGPRTDRSSFPVPRVVEVLEVACEDYDGGMPAWVRATMAEYPHLRGGDDPPPQPTGGRTSPRNGGTLSRMPSVIRAAHPTSIPMTPRLGFGLMLRCLCRPQRVEQGCGKTALTPGCYMSCDPRALRSSYCIAATHALADA
jgi:hypothetical protein